MTNQKIKIMRKFFTVATLLMFVAMGCSNAQGGQGKYEFAGIYTLEFSDQVRINIGGASQNKSSKEWSGGSKVGNHTIDAETFKKLQSATTSKIKIEIEKFKVGTIQKVRATDLTTGKVSNGIYDSRKNQLTIGSSVSQKASNGAGKTQVGFIKAKFNTDKSALTNGTFDVGVIAGKAPLLVSAKAVFNFNAKKVTKE